MAWYTALLGVGVDKVIKAVGDVLDELYTSADEKEKNKIAMAQVRVAAAQAERETAAEIDKAYAEDAKDLRRQIATEIQSQDAYVRRARPTFNYVFYCIIVLTYIIFPVINSFLKTPIELPPLPTQLWTVFGIGFVGYGYLRTVEKTGKRIPVPGENGS